MENISRTIYGSYLQTCLLMKLPFAAFQMLPNTTLNERFGVQQGIAPDVLPTVGYYVIGNGGHTFTVGANNLSKPEPIQHKGTDASLYSPLPFVLRTQDNDLTPEQRAQYALRRTETHDGVPYFAYYARRIDLSNTAPQMQMVTVQDGNSTTVPFVPDSSNLNPVPQTLSSDGVNLVSGDYAAATAKVALDLANWDVSELLNVAKVLYGDESYAIISELGIVSGVDKNVQSPGPNNTTINQNEVVCAQIVSHVNVFWPLVFNNNGTEILLDVGATEPLFNLE